MKCLNKYSYKEFCCDVSRKLKISNWMIRKGNPQDRIDEVKNKDYYKVMQARAQKSKFIKVQPIEIISWLDTMNLLYHTLYYVDTDIQNELTIIQEYKMPFGNKRADYLLLYRNKILIIEYSFNKLGNEYNYETKLTQAMGYKETLINVLPRDIRVATYTFIINPEEDEEKRTIYTHDRFSNDDEQANSEKMKEFASFIDLYFKQTEQPAIEALENLDINITKIDEKKTEKEIAVF